MYKDAIISIFAIAFMLYAADAIFNQSAKEDLRKRQEQCRQSEERLSRREKQCSQREEEVSRAEEGIRRREEKVSLREAQTGQGVGQVNTWEDRLDQIRQRVRQFNQGARPATPENRHDTESDDDRRRRLAQEEAASNACIRHCPGCFYRYIKIDGCNAVTCPNSLCGTRFDFGSGRRR